jgi:hypothetical protein
MSEWLRKLQGPSIDTDDCAKVATEVVAGMQALPDFSRKRHGSAPVDQVSPPLWPLSLNPCAWPCPEP